MLNECKWEADDDGIYSTECGEAFVFEADGPKENSFKFCCFCGGSLIDTTEYSTVTVGLEMPLKADGMMTCTLTGVSPKC